MPIACLTHDAMPEVVRDKTNGSPGKTNDTVWEKLKMHAKKVTILEGWSTK